MSFDTSIVNTTENAIKVPDNSILQSAKVSHSFDRGSVSGKDSNKLFNDLKES